MKPLFLSILFITLFNCSYSQGIAINNNSESAHSSAMLDVSSNSKGILIPRMDKSERNNIINPAIGLLVFQSGPDSTGFYYYSGAKWQWLMSSGDVEFNSWSRKGNLGTDSTINFIGTLDNQPLQFRHYNKWIGKWSLATQNYFVGDSTGSKITGVGNIAMGAWSLKKATNSNHNIAIGYQAMSDAWGPDLYDNTIIGRQAFLNGRNQANTAVGAYTLYYDTSGILNTALGYGSLYANTKGFGATGVGAYSLANNDSCNLTTGIGYYSLYLNRRNYSTAVGAFAGYFNGYNTSSADMGIENTMVGYAAMTGNAKGSKNTVLGYKAMSMFEPGQVSTAAPSRNVAVGDSALQQNRGDDNVAIGFRALSKNTTNHHKSVAIGSRSLTNATATYPNAAVGYLSLDSMTTGTGNTALGSFTISHLRNGNDNTAVGNTAMYEARGNNLAVSGNTAIGFNTLRKAQTAYQTAVGAFALQNDTAGQENVAVGVSAMLENRKGSFNVAMGSNALKSVDDGNFNVSLGAYSMFRSKSSLSNTAIGHEAMNLDSTGDDNTSVGKRSMRYIKNGIQNVSIGAYSMEYTDSSRFSVAVGRGALTAAEGDYNTAIGYMASGFTNFNPDYKYLLSRTTSVGAFAGYRNQAEENTFGGFYSGHGLIDSITGKENTGFGAYSLASATTGASNTGVGYAALYKNQLGRSNVAIGVRALFNTTAGLQNVAVGDSALLNNVASYNTAVGTFALRNNYGGFYNVAMGSEALMHNTTGYSNVGIGRHALFLNSSGSYNSAIGFLAGPGTDTLDNTTAIGAYATVWQDNSVVIGSIAGLNNASVTAKVGIGTPTPDANLHVAGTSILEGNTTINGSLKVGANGTTMSSILRVYHPYDLPSISSGGTHIMTVNVPGASTNASVIVSPEAQLTAGMIIAYARVASANTVTVHFVNTSSIIINNAITNYSITIIQ